MSYTRSYSASITLHGSKQVHYPASNSGGWMTVNYSVEEPIHIDIGVETTPFDASVFQTGINVDSLTGSVVALNAAQVAAITDNAKQISEHLTDGFYGMIRSDISMKQSENFSQLQAKIALLMELSKETASVHGRMEEDIARLHRHYGAIFQGLNEDLEKRIAELDKPAFQLGQQAKRKLLVEPVTTTVSSTAEAISNTSQMSSKISMGRLKKLISSAVSDISESVRKSMEYKTQIEHILSNSEEGSKEYIPVAYFKAAGGAGTQFLYYAPAMNGSDTAVAGVSEYVAGRTNEQWGRLSADEQVNLDREFVNLVEENSRNSAGNSEYNSRVHEEIMKLWNNNKKAMTKLYQERQEQ